MSLRKFIATLILGIIWVSAFSQTDSADSVAVIPKKIFRSTFIGAAGGANIMFGTESLTELKGYARFNVSVDAYVGRWFNKSVGARLVYSGINSYAVDASDPNPDNRIRVTLNTVNARADLLWNMNNSLGGFNPYRVWTLAPYVGVGYLGMKPKESTTLYNSEIHTIGMTAGLYNIFRISNVVSFTIDLRATTFDSKDFNANNANKRSSYATLVSGTAGLAVKISRNWFVKKNASGAGKVKKSKRTKGSSESVAVPTSVSNAALEAKIAQLEEKASELEKQLADANKAAESNVKKTQVTVVTVKKEEPKAVAASVEPLNLFFEVGRPTLGLKELMKLETYIANVIKNNPDKVFVIVGAVDKVQGNTDLADKRAKYIYNLLKSKYGVKSSQLVNEGAHYSPEYNKANLNRVVIIK